MTTINSTQLVLQGELGVACLEDKLILKTPIPTTCTVLIAYNKNFKIGILAHIDDYTSVSHTIDKIKEVLNFKFIVPFLASTMEVSIMGGTEDEYSVKQKKLVLKHIKECGITPKCLSLNSDVKQRTQIGLDISSGQIIFYKNKDQNLETLQLNEYGAFNDLLDEDYPNVSGIQIPDFEVKEAKRTEKDLTVSFNVKRERFTIDKIIEESRNHLPIYPRRVVFKEQTPSVKLHYLVTTYFSEDKPILKSLKEKNYNLMLRQTSAETKHYFLLEYLFHNKSTFGIDLLSRGEKSGTAEDVAEKCNNEQALKLLKSSK